MIALYKPSNDKKNNVLKLSEHSFDTNRLWQKKPIGPNQFLTQTNTPKSMYWDPISIVSSSFDSIGLFEGTFAFGLNDLAEGDHINAKQINSGDIFSLERDETQWIYLKNITSPSINLHPSTLILSQLNTSFLNGLLEQFESQLPQKVFHLFEVHNPVETMAEDYGDLERGVVRFVQLPVFELDGDVVGGRMAGNHATLNVDENIYNKIFLFFNDIISKFGLQGGSICKNEEDEIVLTWGKNEKTLSVDISTDGCLWFLFNSKTKKMDIFETNEIMILNEKIKSMIEKFKEE